jgi:hypothetical protein
MRRIKKMLTTAGVVVSPTPRALLGKTLPTQQKCSNSRHRDFSFSRCILEVERNTPVPVRGYQTKK